MSTPDELDTLLDQHEATLQRIKDQARRESDQRASDLATFERLCEEVIGPLIEEVGLKLKARGHDYTVDRGADAAAPSLRFRFRPSGYAGFTDRTTPELVYKFHPDTTQVETSGETVTPSLPPPLPAQVHPPFQGRSYPLGDVTAETIRTDLMEFLKAVLTVEE